MKLKLPTVTIWASMHSKDEAYFERTLRVLRYINRIIEPADIVFFSHIPTKEFTWFESHTHNSLDWRWMIPVLVREKVMSDYNLQIHEDGFPIDINQWTPEFLNYDYIGSPWPDKSVGNGGFNLQSKRFNWLSGGLVASDELPDVKVCRTFRKALEDMDMQYAPFDIASRFGCEFPGFKDIPHFGFHGQSPHGDYAKAWKILEATE